MASTDSQKHDESALSIIPMKDVTPSGQFQIGMECIFGENGIGPPKYGIELLKQAALAGDRSSQVILGSIYRGQHGHKPDYAEAIRWLQMAAGQGSVEAQGQLGEMFDNGEGVAQDSGKAAYWYQKAAAQGDATAQHCLGVCYERGEGVAIDLSHAATWYERAAKQGFSSSQFNLGLMYYQSRGVSKDINKAIYWLKMAAQQGDQDAVKMLQVISSGNPRASVNNTHPSPSNVDSKPNAAGNEEYTRLLNLGVQKKRAGQYEDARNFYRQAIVLDRSHPMAYYNLAKVSYLLKDRQGSTINYVRTLHISVYNTWQNARKGIPTLPVNLAPEVEQYLLSIHEAAVFLPTQVNTTKHLGHAIMDLDQGYFERAHRHFSRGRLTAQHLSVILSLVEEYRKSLLGYPADIDEKLEEPYHQLGAGFAVKNIVWSKFNGSFDVQKLYPDSMRLSDPFGLETQQHQKAGLFAKVFNR